MSGNPKIKKTQPKIAGFLGMMFSDLSALKKGFSLFSGICNGQEIFKPQQIQAFSDPEGGSAKDEFPF